jgi:hypothetical protein
MYMANAFIIDTCRTPRGIGKQGKGALSDVRHHSRFIPYHKG